VACADALRLSFNLARSKTNGRAQVNHHKDGWNFIWGDNNRIAHDSKYTATRHGHSGTQTCAVGWIVLTRLANSRLLKHVAVLAGGTLLAQIIMILAQPILTRLYNPTDMGLFGAYLALQGTLSTIVSLCYGSAVPVPKDDDEGFDVASLALICTLLFSAITFAVVAIWGASIADALRDRGLTPLLWLLPASLMVFGLNEVLSFLVIRQQRYPVLARVKLSQSIALSAAQIGLGVISSGAIGLVAGYTVGSLSGFGRMLKSHSLRSLLAINRARVKRLLQVAKTHRRFPLLTGPAQFLERLALDVPLLAIFSLHGPVVAGHYALAYRMIAGPLNILAASVSQVFLGELAALGNKSRKETLGLLKKILALMCVTGVPLVLVIALWGGQLFGFAFGSDWTESGEFARVMSVVFLMAAVSNPTGAALLVFKRQDMHIARAIIRLALAASAYAISYVMALNPIQTVLVFSIAGGVGYLVYLILSVLALYRATDPVYGTETTALA
jgi:O-antigen/teichoic acid export membrane protein